MKVLAVDTATAGCSVALLDDQVLLGEETVPAGQSPARRLMRLIAELMHRNRVGREDLDLFAVTRGPGSFTGLRIGMATVQGLALAAGKPVVAISTLEALAAQAAAGGVVAALIDARRGEVYTAVYRDAADGLAVLAPEAVLGPRAAAQRIQTPCLLVGSGAVAYGAELTAALGPGARMAPDGLHTLHAGSVARLALGRPEAAVAPGRLTPCYLRAADAKRPRPRR